MQLPIFIILSYFSYLFGLLVNIKFPKPFNKFIIKGYCKIFDVNMLEFQGTLADYHCLGDFFIRELKKDSRQIQSSFVSPVDGTIRNINEICGENTIQVKNKSYSINKLAIDPAASEIFLEGLLFNFYLSPKDYHHIHIPFDAKINSIKYIPGTLWPVNDLSLNLVSELFAINERVVVCGEAFGGNFMLVLVGAYNVGKISLTINDQITNKHFKNRKVQEYLVNKSLQVGDKLGTFHLGSSVVF